VDGQFPSFKEEIYFVVNLKQSEKKPKSNQTPVEAIVITISEYLACKHGKGTVMRFRLLQMVLGGLDMV